MKRKFFKFTLIALIAMGGAFTSCSKKEGPQGPEGPQGEQGIQGVQGIPGKDGSVIISGTATPTDDLGKVGDMFLDTKNNKLYGPKAAKKPVWGTPLDIKGNKGDKGDRGDDGSVIYSGKGEGAGPFGMFDPPTPKDHHKSGDYFIHTENGFLYILELEITSLSPPIITKKWKKVISLKGPKGDKGDKGNDGNANVIATKWKKIEYSQWSDYGNYQAYYYTVPTPILNAVGVTHINDFVSSKFGTLLIYLSNSSGQIMPIPTTLFDYKKQLYYMISEDTNVITFYYDDPDKKFEHIDPSCSIRYVLIPASKTFVARGVDLTKLSYEEVKELYGLED